MRGFTVERMNKRIVVCTLTADQWHLFDGRPGRHHVAMALNHAVVRALEYAPEPSVARERIMAEMDKWAIHGANTEEARRTLEMILDETFGEHELFPGEMELAGQSRFGQD